MSGHKHPMLSMRAAQQAGLATGPITEVPLDLFIQDIRGETYLALRAGEHCVLLTECEAEAVAAAMKKLSVFASALNNARDYIGKVPPDDRT